MSQSEAQKLAGHYKFDHAVEVFRLTGDLTKSSGCFFMLCLATALIGGWITFTWYIGVIALIGTYLITLLLKPLFPKKDSNFFRKSIIIRLESTLKTEQDSSKLEACRTFLDKLKIL